MRNLTIDKRARCSARMKLATWGATSTAALVIALGPTTAQARFAPPSSEVTPIEPTPTPPPAPALVVPHELEPMGPTRYTKMRRAGTGLMITGGTIASTGLGMVIAFTIIGDREQERREPVDQEIERADTLTAVGGGLLASGLVVLAAGGIMYARASRMQKSEARVRLTPTLGGVVLSGQF